MVSGLDGRSGGSRRVGTARGGGGRPPWSGPPSLQKSGAVDALPSVVAHSYHHPPTAVAEGSLYDAHQSYDSYDGSAGGEGSRGGGDGGREVGVGGGVNPFYRATGGRGGGVALIDDDEDWDFSGGSEDERVEARGGKEAEWMDDRITSMLLPLNKQKGRGPSINTASSHCPPTHNAASYGEKPGSGSGPPLTITTASSGSNHSLRQLKHSQSEQWWGHTTTKKVRVYVYV